jgi:hypothetical protein
MFLQIEMIENLIKEIRFEAQIFTEKTKLPLTSEEVPMNMSQPDLNFLASARHNTM